MNDVSSLKVKLSSARNQIELLKQELAVSHKVYMYVRMLCGFLTSQMQIMSFKSFAFVDVGLCTYVGA